MKREFDITGFVHFPGELHPTIKRLNTGKTFVYLTAFDTDFSFSKVNLRTKGHFSGDDLTPEHHVDTSLMTIDDLVKLMKSESNISINTLGDLYVKDLKPIYVQNINNINRSGDQTESFKLIIQV